MSKLNLETFLNFQFVTPRELEGEVIKAVFQATNDSTFILTKSNKLCGYCLDSYIDYEDYECTQIKEIEYDYLIENLENLFYNKYFIEYNLFNHVEEVKKVIEQYELEEELKFEEQQKKLRYEQYLKLKKEFEGGDAM